MVAEKVDAVLFLTAKNSQQHILYRGCLAWAHAECRTEDMTNNRLAANPVVASLGKIQLFQIVAGIGEPEEAQDFRAFYSILGISQYVGVDIVHDDTNL